VRRSAAARRQRRRQRVRRARQAARRRGRRLDCGQRRHEGLPVGQRARAQVVPLRGQARQQRLEAARHIQQRSGAHGARSRRETVQHNRDTLVGVARASQRHPGVHAARQRTHALQAQVDAVAHQAA
jgi:hypothetical protein